MLEAAFWGLIQGLTEFLPISSSGHLVLVPALLGMDQPDLAVTAMLHLGTLAAVLAYFRKDVANVLRFTEQGKRLLWVLIIGTIPAAIIGLAFESSVEGMTDHPKQVAVALLLTGVVLIATYFIRRGQRVTEDAGPLDAVTIGLGQAIALIPGVSRSGATISTGLLRGFTNAEAARLSFLLGIPAIAGAGLLEGRKLIDSGTGISANVLVGVAVAAISGYAAIALLLRLIKRAGVAPFGIYCVVAAVVSFIVL